MIRRFRGLDLIPCPKCMGAAEYVPASPGQLARSVCLSGEHEHSLSPDVDKTLHEIAKRAQRYAEERRGA